MIKILEAIAIMVGTWLLFITGLFVYIYFKGTKNHD